MISLRFTIRVALCSLAVLAASCDVDPYCLTCGEDDASVPSDTDPNGTRDAPVFDATFLDVIDVGPRDDAGCLAAELCNNEDDDCDDVVDEGIDLERDPAHCGGCNQTCSPPHAFPVCNEGECSFSECDVGWLDINNDPSDGCEYRCLQTAEDDVLCDLRDNDCDGNVDEDVDLPNDPANCGSCGRVCRFPHSTASCMDSMCRVESCEPGFIDNDGRPDNGCEYACTPADMSVEVCNVRDDDCDGMIDEGDPGGGEECGINIGVGICTAGTTQCIGGSVECVGGLIPTTELCNGMDDDCDGNVDENNPEGGRLCGTRTGECVQGREECVDGGLICVGAVDPVPEICDGRDQDCNGLIDDGNPGGGAICGSEVGFCGMQRGTEVCMNGGFVCMGANEPRAELCNGIDDNCDGVVDENNPEGGSLCGSDLGQCRPGIQECISGMLECTGQTLGNDETCNGLDDDCDGNTDENNPGGGAACGETEGECAAGSVVCRSGTLTCEGFTGPTAEICDGEDDDCDGNVDEAFDFVNDPNNCGGCGVSCARPNALGICQTSACTIVACDDGWFDVDGDPMNGCEYNCDFAGAEGCNNEDDDCDGAVDEMLTPPANFCLQAGVCSGTEATCGGASGWQCNYPSAYEDTETLCDTIDNDCDNSVDEAFPLVGTSCSTGTGSCEGFGSYVCNGTSDFECNATPADTPDDEECNARDDDCDGLVDEVGADDPGTSWRDALDLSAFDTVTVDRFGGGTMEIMQFEASRPDATSIDGGTNEVLACSRGGVLPWTDVTWTEARDACCAMNPGGTCPGAMDVGWRLCDGADWGRACQGEAGTCDWAYTNTCSTSQPMTCNGKERDSSGLPGDQDAIEPTENSAMCGASWTAGVVYDLSGNVKEWTATEVLPGIYQQRGGAYTTIEVGRQCDFEFTVASAGFAFPNTGFRCCYY